MAEIIHFSRAPIIEAIIDIRIKPEIRISSTKLSEFAEKIGDSYPHQESRNLFESQVELVPSQQQISQSTREKGLHGFFFRSKNEQNIAQFRVNGFTFNHLKPYTKWNLIFQEAKNLWNIYVDILAPKSVDRIAVRYINHIMLPSTVTELSQYVALLPQIPNELPNTVGSYLVKMVLVDEQTKIKANITQALESNIASDDIPIIFDIDVYKEHSFSPNDPAIWEVFSDLRDMKNRIFFSYITEKTTELFK